LALIFKLSQFLAQASGFGAILLRLEAELGGTDGAECIDNLGDTTTAALAGMFELVFSSSGSPRSSPAPAVDS